MAKKPVPTPATSQLPEPCRASLFVLYVKAKRAQADYELAVAHALSALGFDTKANNELNIDTGVITVAPATTDAAPQDGG